MSIFETFSKRAKRLEKTGTPDVYQYDDLPGPFRVQVAHIWNHSIGAYYRNNSYSSNPVSPAVQFWDLIFGTLCRELGVFSLGDPHSNHAEQCIQYLLGSETLGGLDIIELSFRVIDRFTRDLDAFDRKKANINQDADNAIEELNERFFEHGIGYRYTNGILMRMDSEYVHKESVIPALSLLHEEGFEGPSEEFMRAYLHYRHNDFKAAIAEALKAFESTMKAICKVRSWSHPPNATAVPLIAILFEKGIIPLEMQSHFGALRSAMESGLPTLSNKTSRHGQGADPIAIPSHIAAYALHLAAVNIVFLVEAHKAYR